MTAALVGAGIAGLLVLGFALGGEALLGRASRSLFGWNESFLIGAGVCAALLFPLSVASPRHALDAELVLMALGAFVTVRRRVRRVPRPRLDASPDIPRLPGDLRAIANDGFAILLLAAILFLVGFFGAFNLWHGHSWDSVQAWATKAQRLFVEGGLSRTWFAEDAYDRRLLSYPPLIPFVEALFSRVRGKFELEALKSIFPFFYASMLLSTYAAARTLCSRRWALATVLLIALLPELSTGSAAGGYADMPLAAYVAAVVGASLLTDDSRVGWRSPVPWLIGAMTAVKQEGVLLALAACAAIALFWLTERPRSLARRVRTAWTGAAVVLGFVLARAGYVLWIGAHDATWGPLDSEHLARALQNVTLIVALCLRLLLDPRTWGLFWPAFLVAAAWTAASGLRRPTILALATAGTAVAYAAVFLMTNWPVEVHIEGSYSRLLAQLAPAAAVVIGAAGARIWSERPGIAA